MCICISTSTCSVTAHVKCNTISVEQLQLQIGISSRLTVPNPGSEITLGEEEEEGKGGEVIK